MMGMPLDETDVAYVSDQYQSLARACEQCSFDESEIRTLMLAGRLPLPCYVLPNGTPMVPHDYFQLLAEAGSVDALPALFQTRLAQAARDQNLSMEDAEVEAAWFGFLSGHWGVCLNNATPESIVAKTKLIGEVRELLSEPQTDSRVWRECLREAVNALDALERTFTRYDHIRFGRLPSRVLYVDQVREKYPEAFADQAAVSQLP